MNETPVTPEELAAFFTGLNARYTQNMIDSWPTCEANHSTLVMKAGPKWRNAVSH